MKFVRILMCILMTISITGCGVASVSTDADVGDEIYTLGIEPDFNYVRELQSSHISLDKEGYLPSSKKVFYITGKDMSEDFGILDASTDELIYSGTLNRVGDVAEGDSLYMGDFSGLSEEGSYRIFQNNVGYSDAFTVDRELYKKLFKNIDDSLKSYEYENNSSRLFPLAMMMLTKEIYSEAPVDDGYISKNMEYLVSQQDFRTGGVFQESISSEELEEMEAEAKEAGENFDTATLISLSTTAQYAGVMAQYLSDYPLEDFGKRTQYMQSASRAFGYVEKYRDNVEDASIYYAACELYRLTGQLKYKNYILTTDAVDTENRQLQGDYALLGDIAYLNTSYKTEYQLCEKIMGDYMDRASDISMKTGRDCYYVQSDILECDKGQILDNMIVLGLVSYVLSGNEYASIEYNYLHYLCGNNVSRTDYFRNESAVDELGIAGDSVAMSKLLYVLGSDYIQVDKGDE